MKKYFSLILLALLPLVANAQDPVEIDGIWYNLIVKAKLAEVTSNPDKYSGEVNIPASFTYDGKEFSVTSISNSAFSGCSSLTSVTIGNSVTSIGSYAFSGCSGLTSVTIGNSVTSIGEDAFRGCSTLTSVTIPNSVTSIDEEAFYYCTSLTSITIPNSVKSIRHDAFYGCNSLTFVHITDVAAWCKIAFYGYDANPLYFAHHLYMNGEEIKDLVIPNSVTSIGEYAFSGCSGLTSVTIGHSVTSIGREAFEYCTGLTSITIPNSVTSIGNYAFCGCSTLTSVTIPNSVTSIGDNAFLNCSGLTSVTIGNNVTSIGRWAFEGCSGLTSVTIISNRATSIGCYSFNGCSRLNIIILGSSVRSLGSSTSATTGHTFANCPELTDVWCYAEKVPSAYSNDFESSYIEYATLHVPAESIELYKAKAPWSKFGTILAIEEEFSEEQQLFLAQYDELLAAAKDKLNAFKQKQQEEQTGKLISNASQLISPYTESSEGSLANLLDENTSTFWHSSWRGGTVENGIHYLQVDLINPVNVDIYLTFTRRNISSDQVTNMSVLATNDADAAKTDCKELLTFGCPYNSSTETITSPQFNTKGYRYLRIYANATNSNRGYWHMAEFQFYRVTTPSESLADYLDGEDERLQDIIDRLAGLGRNQIGQDEYDALKEAYDAFMAKLADAADGIGSLKDSKDLKVSWHSLDGRRLPAPQKGVNIIRYPDGSTKKVLLK